jgi:hypothetical protein
MTERIDITGIDKGVLLAELFNRGGIIGLGFLQAGRGPDDAMTHDQGREIVARALAGGSEADHARMFGQQVLGRRRLYFDYLYGRCLKVDLSGDQVDPWGYDRDNGGPGAFQRVVEVVRQMERTRP